MNSSKLRVKFIVLWALLQFVKLSFALTLPLFVDEAFYAWEGRFPAWAYSDLPGLTAFLTRLGTAVGGQHPLAVRAPFLLIGALVPWLVVRIARRWFDSDQAWLAGLLCLLMPLGGLLGVLALPDVPLVFAALVCLDAIAALRERVSVPALLGLAAALAIGALSHYRFALVIAAGLAGLGCDARGRALLRNSKVWVALLAGALAWLPLLGWNLAHAGAGLRFQVLERNPWAFHADGLSWIPIQFLLVTPVLFVLLLATLRRAVRHRAEPEQPWGLLAGVAGVSVLGYFVLGLFADNQRVSFHWPLSGWIALVVAAPVVLQRWSRPAKFALFSCAGVGLLAGIAVLTVASVPSMRASMAGSRFYPADFAGWPELSRQSRQLISASRLPVVAGDFEVAAELVFALNRPDIEVLDNPLNHKHGRAAQLQAWGLVFTPSASRSASPFLLVVDDSTTPMKLRLQAYHRLCSAMGWLPVTEVLNVDHGRKRYLMYRMEGRGPGNSCPLPALAYIDAPEPGKSVEHSFDVSGWAFKDGAGLNAVEVTLDGNLVAHADYGFDMPNVRDYWRISNDPNQPRVGFRARVDAGAMSRGPHWLGLVLHGADGSVEPWPEQRILIR